MNIQKFSKEIQEYITTHCFKKNFETPFTLSTGEKSPYYFNLKQALLFPKIQNKIAHTFLYTLQKEKIYPKAIAGLTMGSDPLLYSISLLSLQEKLSKQVIYPIIIRKQAKQHGTKNQIEYYNKIKKNDCIILFDDVITTGNSTIKALSALLNAGFTNIKKVYCIINRQEKEKNYISENNLEEFSLFTIKDFL